MLSDPRWPFSSRQIAKRCYPSKKDILRGAYLSLKVLGMPKRWRSKKAVSPVIANVLMVMAVFALGTILFAWATSSFGMYQGGAGVWFVNRGEAMKERLVIEQVSFTSQYAGPIPPPANELIIIYVRNVGTIDCRIVAIYVNASAAPSMIQIVNPPLSPGITLKVGSVTSINVTLVKTWHSGSVSTIGVATARGNIVSGTWKA